MEQLLISISGGAGAGGTWGIKSVGVHKLLLILSAKSGVSLYIVGAEFAGNVNI